MPLDPNPSREPIEVDLRSVLFGRGIHVVAVTVPAEAPPPFDGAQGLLFQFGVDGLPDGHIRVFVPVEALDPDLGEAFTAVLSELHNPESLAESAARARIANERAGHIPGHAPIRCPGCNQRLFGAIANRGGCLGCYPDLPPATPDGDHHG